MSTILHGKASSYSNRNCKCDKCIAEWASYNPHYRRRVESIRSAARLEPPQPMDWHRTDAPVLFACTHAAKDRVTEIASSFNGTNTRKTEYCGLCGVVFDQTKVEAA